MTWHMRSRVIFLKNFILTHNLISFSDLGQMLENKRRYREKLRYNLMVALGLDIRTPFCNAVICIYMVSCKARVYFVYCSQVNVPTNNWNFLCAYQSNYFTIIIRSWFVTGYYAIFIHDVHTLKCLNYFLLLPNFVQWA